MDVHGGVVAVATRLSSNRLLTAVREAVKLLELPGDVGMTAVKPAAVGWHSAGWLAEFDEAVPKIPSEEDLDECCYWYYLFGDGRSIVR